MRFGSRRVVKPGALKLSGDTMKPLIDALAELCGREVATAP